jgi:Arc/MetJ-type ribon-helix-helix transcriptional regulator
MSNAARNPVELPDDLQAFAEEQVRAGRSPSVAHVVREALEDKKLAVLREALDVGVAELDAGKGVETSPEDLMDEVFAEVGLEP